MGDVIVYVGCEFFEDASVPVADPVPEPAGYQADGWESTAQPVSGGAMPGPASDPQTSGFVVPPAVWDLLGQVVRSLLAKWLK